MMGARISPGDTAPLTPATKIAFALGGAGAQICGTIASFFLNPWLLQVVSLRPGLVGVILLSGRLWDAVTDPIVGHCSDRTSFAGGSCCIEGRRRPWMLGALLPCSLTYLALFTSPDTLGLPPLESQGAKLVWYCLAYWGYQGAFTAYYVPYTSLTMELSTDPAERDSATLWRMVCEVLAVMAAVVFQSFLIAAMAPEGAPRCDEQRAYFMSAAIVSGVIILTNGASVWGVRERNGQPQQTPPPPAAPARHGSSRSSRLAGIRCALSCRPYLQLNAAYLCTWLCFQVLSTNLVLYLQWTLELYSQFQYILGSVLASAVLCMAGLATLMKRYGWEKRTVYMVGMLAYVPFPLAMFLVPDLGLGAPPQPGYGWVIYVISVGSGMGVATSFLLPWSLLPDTIDEAERTTGQRHEGLFYSLFVFFGKLAASLSLGLSSLGLELAGFDGEADPPTQGGFQLPEVTMTLRVLVGIVPAVLALGAVAALWSYPIDEARRQETACLLAARRRGAAAAAAGAKHTAAAVGAAGAEAVHDHEGGGGGAGGSWLGVSVLPASLSDEPMPALGNTPLVLGSLAAAGGHAQAQEQEAAGSSSNSPGGDSSLGIAMWGPPLPPPPPEYDSGDEPYVHPSERQLQPAVTLKRRASKNKRSNASKRSSKRTGRAKGRKPTPSDDATQPSSSSSSVGGGPLHLPSVPTRDYSTPLLSDRHVAR